MGDVHYLPIGSILIGDNERSIFIISSSGQHSKELLIYLQQNNVFFAENLVHGSHRFNIIVQLRRVSIMVLHLITPFLK